MEEFDHVPLSSDEVMKSKCSNWNPSFLQSDTINNNLSWTLDNIWSNKVLKIETLADFRRKSDWQKQPWAEFQTYKVIIEICTKHVIHYVQNNTYLTYLFNY